MRSTRSSDLSLTVQLCATPRGAGKVDTGQFLAGATKRSAPESTKGARSTRRRLDWEKGSSSRTKVRNAGKTSTTEVNYLVFDEVLPRTRSSIGKPADVKVIVAPSKKSATKPTQSHAGKTRKTVEHRSDDEELEEKGRRVASKRRSRLTRGKTEQGKSSKNSQGKKYLTETKIDGEVIRVGMDVYVSMLEDDEEMECELAEEEACYVCGCPPGAKGKGAMLECDGCLKGFHLKCLRPPLKEVPEGDWYCPECLGCLGEYTITKKTNVTRTAREMYFNGKLELMRVEKMWKTSEGAVKFDGRWYYRPESTELGRQPHHGRREVFLSNHFDENDASVIIKEATVLSPAQFRAATDAGDDVYLCEYDYDAGWRRFRRRVEDEEQWNAFEDDSDDNYSDADDVQFDPKAEWKNNNRNGDKGSMRSRQSKARKGANVRCGRGSEGTLGLGALEIPACVRAAERTPLAKARASLALSSVPKKLPCREKERHEIRSFVEEAIRAASSEGNCQGRCLYISGVPGTGKTATVMEVLRELRKEADNKKISPFQFVEINGLRLPSPQHAYSVLYESLAGRYVSPSQAAEFLEEHFKSKRQPNGRGCKQSKKQSEVTILLVDELDLLVTRKQDVLYNIFDWPTYKNARVAVIGIANTMDLPERLLPRIISRMGLTRLQFSPYTREQIATITQTRLEGVDCFDSRAVEFTSRKVASVSGDVRRALEICRKAAEIRQLKAQKLLDSACVEEKQAAEDSPETWTVTIADVDKAIKEMDDSAHMLLIKSISVHERVMLVALAIAIRRAGTFQVHMNALLEEYYNLCDAHEFEPCPGGDGAVFAATWRMAECRLVLAEHGRTDRHQSLSLNISPDDIAFAIRGNVEPSWLTRHLQVPGV